MDHDTQLTQDELIRSAVAAAIALVRPPQVYEAITKAIALVGKIGVGKLGENAEQGYKFRSIDDVYGAVNRALVEARLVIIPATITREVREGKSKHGATIWHVTLRQMFTFVCSIDGSSREVGPFYGEAFDTSDKATNKAMTAAFKYMLIEVFCIPLEGADDADGNTHEMEHGSSRALDNGGSTKRTQVIDTDTISPAQVATLKNRLDDAAISHELFLEKAGGIFSIEEVPVASYDAALAWIDRQVKRMKERAKAEQQAAAAMRDVREPDDELKVGIERQPGGTPIQAPEAHVATHTEPAVGTSILSKDGATYRVDVAGVGYFADYTHTAQPAVGQEIDVNGEGFRVIEIHATAKGPTLVVDKVKPAGKKAGKS